MVVGSRTEGKCQQGCRVCGCDLQDVAKSVMVVIKNPKDREWKQTQGLAVLTVNVIAQRARSQRLTAPLSSVAANGFLD